MEKKESNRNTVKDVQKGSTVIVRHAQPKYSFQTSLNKTESRKVAEKQSRIPSNQSELIPVECQVTTDENVKKAERCASCVPNRNAEFLNAYQKCLTNSSDEQRNLLSRSYLVPTLNLNTGFCGDEIKKLIGEEGVFFNSVPQQQNQHLSATAAQLVTNDSTVKLPKPVNVVDPLHSGNVTQSEIILTGSQKVKTLSSVDFFNGTKCWRDACQHQMSCSQNEIGQLKSQLGVQFQVNAELKKLLIASVGEDLQYRVEKLIRDKVQLSIDIGGYSKKLTEDYENLDKISIQADMWRSKYLASRVMIDELARGRAMFATQYQDSQDALQQLLNERHELQSHLMECYRFLKLVKEAFDPLNANKYSELHSENVLDIAKINQQLAEAIRFRLLPGGVSLQQGAANSRVSWDDRLTPAEAFAQEILSRSIGPVKPHHNCVSSPMPPFLMKIDRYHPLTRFENLTLNCCTQCKGDISVV